MELVQSVNLNVHNTILEAFEAINGRFGIVVTIIDNNERLCGIVSEGDLRRAMLNGDSSSAPLERIMNKKPVMLKMDDLRDDSKQDMVIDEMKKLYESQQVQQATIPVVDKNDKVLGLVMPEMLCIRDSDNKLNRHAKMARPQVLVVGGAGYIGSVTVKELLDEGWRVKVLDNMLYMQTSLDNINNEHLSIIRGDVANINDLVESIEGIDAVVYLAEIVGDAACAHRPGRALKTNYLSVSSLAHLCAYLNISRFVYASSCSVYGGSKEPHRYLTEESKLNPLSHYGRMKIMAEEALFNISNPLFCPTILRLATVFGYSYRPRFDLIVNLFAKNAFFYKKIEIFGGDQWRPNIHVTDVAKAIAEVLKAPIDKVKRQIFNVCSIKENHIINELGELTKKAFPGVKMVYRNDVYDARNYRVDSGKIERVLGYSAKISVPDGLKELKNIFEKGDIKNPENPCYSNIAAIKEFVYK